MTITSNIQQFMSFMFTVLKEQKGNMGFNCGSNGTFSLQIVHKQYMLQLLNLKV